MLMTQTRIERRTSLPAGPTGPARGQAARESGPASRFDRGRASSSLAASSSFRGRQPLARVDHAPGRGSRVASSIASSAIPTSRPIAAYAEGPDELVSRRRQSSRCSGRDGKKASATAGFASPRAISTRLALRGRRRSSSRVPIDFPLVETDGGEIWQRIPAESAVVGHTLRGRQVRLPRRSSLARFKSSMTWSMTIRS